jgi:hypothetical protein
VYAAGCSDRIAPAAAKLNGSQTPERRRRR